MWSGVRRQQVTFNPTKGKVINRSNHMYELNHLVWFGSNASEKGVAAAHRNSHSWPFCKGLEKCEPGLSSMAWKIMKDDIGS